MADNIVFSSVADLQKLIRGSSNSQSTAMLNSVMADTIGMTMYNAVSTQHNAQILNSAATTSTCAKILSVIGMKQDTNTTPDKDPDSDNNTSGDDSNSSQASASTQSSGSMSIDSGTQPGNADSSTNETGSQDNSKNAVTNSGTTDSGTQSGTQSETNSQSSLGSSGQSENTDSTQTGDS